MDKILFVTFVCEITNNEVFEEYFPDKKLQPHWKLSENKLYIDITMDITNCTETISLEDLVLQSSLDLEFFKEFGNCYCTIKYIKSIKIT